VQFLRNFYKLCIFLGYLCSVKLVVLLNRQTILCGMYIPKLFGVVLWLTLFCDNLVKLVTHISLASELQQRGSVEMLVTLYALNSVLYDLLTWTYLSAFSALTLLVGCQEEHPACIIEWWGVGVVICLEWGADFCMWSSWCHCIPKPHHLLPHLYPDWFHLSANGLPRLSWKRGH